VLQGPLATAGSVVKIVEGDGNAAIFTWDTSANGWQAVGGTDTLDPAALTYTRKSDDSVWQFNGAGQLRTVTQRNGWATTYAYSTDTTPASVAPVAGLLVRVTSQFGRTLSFAYNAASQLVSVTLADGRIVSYAYDGTAATDRLTTVSYPITTGAGAVSKTYLYENPGFPQLVTGILDENGNRYETLSYDSQGRGTSTQLAGGADLYSIDYSMAGTAVVTDPLGTQRTYNYGTAQGKLAVTGADKPSGTGASSAASRVQDANGLVTQETDFLGVNTMYTWDISRRLPLTTTKAATLPEAQTTTTQWHPTFRLPVLVTEAGQTTAYTYDNRGNLLTRTVTDTATNASRTSTWTYNSSGAAQGLPATETDSKGVVTRTYAYYGNSSFAGAVQSDPYFDSVSLLLHGDGADGTTLFTDSSAVPKAVTSMGDTKISTAQSKFGGSSLYFDGVHDYVALPAAPSLTMKSSDFTIEMWVNKLGNNANYSRLWNPDGDYYADLIIAIDPNGNLVSYGSSTGTSWNLWAFATGIPVPNGTWKHVALVRNGGTVTLYLDGVGTVMTTSLGTTALHDGGYSHVIGGQGPNPDRALNGYVDDVRITKGVARYTTNFTPPTQAFPNTGVLLDPNAVGHTAGDLQSITNAVGHVTQFTLYDRAGRVRQMVDPNGVVTDMVYTPRGWTSSVTVTPPGGPARTTTFTYDNAGQLTGVVMPDSTTMSYSYDAAHRLTGITDAKGNTVAYTLDAMGNKVGEQVKDPQGNLQRNITRVYDALNRVQQVTGASN
jgi:YD repeat-containing protein